MTKAYDMAMKKTASMYSTIRDGFRSSDLKEIGMASKLTAGSLGTAMLSAFVIKKAFDKAMTDIKRKAMLEDLIMNDPIIRRADRDKVKQFYATIHSIAPKISGDKSVVKELLQNFIRFDRVDLNSVKTLADTQKSIVQAEGKGLEMMSKIF
jgi:hypothetical protein